jgi:hypothetical protein
MFANPMSRLSYRCIRVIIGRRNTDCSYQPSVSQPTFTLES